MKTNNVVTKKMSFSDDYDLTQAVIELRKTMTRRVCKEIRTGGIIYAKDVESLRMYSDENLVEFVMKDGSIIVSVPKYKVGDVVAVAQSYKSVFEESLRYAIPRWHWLDDHVSEKGFKNKMFVKASEMPHQIQITGVKIERLQAISEEDCLREGVEKYFQYTVKYPNIKVPTYRYFKRGIIRTCVSSASKCFAYLIDDICGKGTWKSNPYVFVYSFELIK